MLRPYSSVVLADQTPRMVMPYFYFNIQTQQGTTTDSKGSWYPDVDTALTEAATAARELVADSIKWNFDHLLPVAIAVTDEFGNNVATVPFDEVLRHCRNSA
jgi:hypothetical protein